MNLETPSAIEPETLVDPIPSDAESSASSPSGKPRRSRRSPSRISRDLAADAVLGASVAVLAVRIPTGLHDVIEAEAGARGVTKSRLVADLLTARYALGRPESPASADHVIAIRDHLERLVSERLAGIEQGIAESIERQHTAVTASLSTTLARVDRFGRQLAELDRLVRAAVGAPVDDGSDGSGDGSAGGGKQSLPPSISPGF